MESETLLRRALMGNAIFSLVSAGIAIIGATALSDRLGVPTFVVVAVGVGLVPFGFGVWRVARAIDRRSVVSIIVMDVAWVLGSVVVIAMPGSLTAFGKLVVGLVGLAVADWAALQMVGLKRLATGS